jgi:hypothetical protein
VTTIEPDGRPALDVWENEFDAELTKRPSASQPFGTDLTMEITSVAFWKDEALEHEWSKRGHTGVGTRKWAVISIVGSGLDVEVDHAM